MTSEGAQQQRRPTLYIWVTKYVISFFEFLAKKYDYTDGLKGFYMNQLQN